jgi:hypothetical protein
MQKAEIPVFMLLESLSKQPEITPFQSLDDITVLSNENSIDY